ncbi:MAG: hypothetical protein OEY14_17070 [Myxococcales bacterium]|nr:hypothetical protein [Myxococcales bacterium]
MDWTQNTTEDLLAFEAEADEEVAEQLACAAAVWALAERELLPRHGSEEWDVLRLEVWPGSARTILFPAREPYEQRTDRVLAQVHWPGLQATWDACESDDALDDEAFDARIGAAVDSIVRAFRDAFEQSSLRDRLRVDCYSYGEEHLCSFGKSPP